MTDVGFLVGSAVLTWLMLMVAGLLNYRAWSLPGIDVMVGNRENVPPPSQIARRTDQAAKNMVENFVLFIALVAAVHFAGKQSAQADLGAAIFFWARVAYWPVYLAGVKYLRTAIWAIGVIGLAIMLLALL
jgi:uncharacterized MAPEG superfamily protein